MKNIYKVVLMMKFDVDILTALLLNTKNVNALALMALGPYYCIFGYFYLKDLLNNTMARDPKMVIVD